MQDHFNIILPSPPRTLDSILRDARKANRIYDFFSIPRLCDHLSPLREHAKDAVEAIKSHIRQAKYLRSKEHWGVSDVLKNASDIRIHLRSIKERALELPVIHDKDFIHRRAIVALCDKWYAKDIRI